jgi:hypothetical protein
MPTNPNDMNEIIQGLAESSDSPRAITEYLTLIPKLSNNVFIRQYIIFHQTSLSEIIIKKAPRFSSLKEVGKVIPAFQISLAHKKNGGMTDKGTLVILPGSQSNISRLITISQSHFWNNIARRLVKSLYPEAMPVFFKQNEIEDALTSLEKGLGLRYRVRIADVTAKEERYKSNQPNKSEIDTQRWWTNLSIQEIFSQAKERGQWFTGLRFVIQRRIGDTDRFVSMGSGRINKFGEIKYDSLHSEISDYLIVSLEKHATDRLNILKGRGIRESNYHPAKPLEIAYRYDIFAEVEDVRMFGKIVSEFPASTKVVYHSNPYYHASVADFLDGSSYDIWVLSTNKIVLIPQAKSTTQALDRFITHIFTNFGEGLVDDYND